MNNCNINNVYKMKKKKKNIHNKDVHVWRLNTQHCDIADRIVCM